MPRVRFTTLVVLLASGCSALDDWDAFHVRPERLFDGAVVAEESRPLERADVQDAAPVSSDRTAAVVDQGLSLTPDASITMTEDRGLPTVTDRHEPPPPTDAVADLVTARCGNRGDPCCGGGRCLPNRVCLRHGSDPEPRCVDCGGRDEPCCGDGTCMGSRTCMTSVNPTDSRCL